jgi:sensor histidine kinase YesM
MNKIDLTNKAKALDLVIQVIVLTMVFVIPEFFFSLGNSRPMSYGMYIHAVLCIITFYFNYFFLIDRYLFRKKTFTYIVLALLTAVVMVMLMVVIQYFIFVNSPDFPQKHNHVEHFNDHRFYLFFIGSITREFAMIILTTGLSIALKFSMRWAKIEKMKEKIISEQRDMELRNLKNQLNPHFLFNTLNNIYALIEIDKDKAQQTVHELSKLLRYTLYENNEKEVTLDKELNFMRSYIELMKLRFGSNVKLTVDIPEDNVNHLKIAPLMFISMVENAFKHGVSSTKPSEINIKMTVDGNRVCCHVENSHFPKPETDKSGSGIGLSNLSRQLSLLYEGRHSFQSGVVGDNTN